MRKSWNDERTSIIYAYNVSGSHSGSTASFLDEADLVWKRTLSKFINTLRLVKIIDLSSKNKLIGEIPAEITELI